MLVRIALLDHGRMVVIQKLLFFFLLLVGCRAGGDFVFLEQTTGKKKRQRFSINFTNTSIKSGRPHQIN